MTRQSMADRNSIENDEFQAAWGDYYTAHNQSPMLCYVVIFLHYPVHIEHCLNPSSSFLANALDAFFFSHFPWFFFRIFWEKESKKLVLFDSNFTTVMPRHSIKYI